MTILFHQNFDFIFEINTNLNLLDFYNNSDNQYNKMLNKKEKEIKR